MISYLMNRFLSNRMIIMVISKALEITLTVQRRGNIKRYCNLNKTVPKMILLLK